jgi:hypothetical protein
LAKITRREAVFLGVTAADSRVFVREFLKERLASHPVVHLPAVGHFLLAKAALQAGYKPENIWTSDISLYTGSLGKLIDPTAEIPQYSMSNELADGYLEMLFQDDRKNSPEMTYAWLLYCMKIIQMEPIAYMADFIEDMRVNRKKHIDRVLEHLQTNLETLAGIHYRHADLREDVPGDWPEDHIVVVNPPIVSNGYTKMYDFGDQITYDPQVEEFSWKKEYDDLYRRSRESAAPFLWSRYFTAEGYPPEEIVYASERRADKVDYWLYTKPQELAGNQRIKSFTRKALRPAKAPLWGLDDVITPDSVVQFVDAPDEVVLYYRDLFAHRLGASGGERNFLMMVDGKVFGSVLLMASDVGRLAGDQLGLTSGFTVPSNVYRRTNRLLNWCITAQQFEDVFRGTTGKNRYYELRGVKTTVFSKYRKTKANNGIWTVRDRERQPNGTYKIHYEADFRKGGTFKDAVKRFLAEEAELAKTPITKEDD